MCVCVARHRNIPNLSPTLPGPLAHVWPIGRGVASDVINSVVKPKHRLIEPDPTSPDSAVETVLRGWPHFEQQLGCRSFRWRPSCRGLRMYCAGFGIQSSELKLNRCTMLRSSSSGRFFDPVALNRIIKRLAWQAVGLRLITCYWSRARVCRLTLTGQRGFRSLSVPGVGVD